MNVQEPPIRLRTRIASTPELPEKNRFASLIGRRKSAIERRLCSPADRREPRSVYEPIAYALGAGGKRLRAVLTLLACEAVGGKVRLALNAAVAIELLHNFTLVHDDIMDHSDLRRGHPTVHKQWNEETAILAGDQLAAIAYQTLLRTTSSRLEEIVDVFTLAFATVCEGQGFDKEFEQRDDVSAADYLMMIDKKTGQMIAAATEIGALAGNGTDAEIRSLRRYGIHLGRAFQLRDDVLDIDGSEQEVGKRIGSDILEGKRTFLLLTAAESPRLGRADRATVEAVLQRKGIGPETIPCMREIYRRTGALDAANRLIGRETAAAQHALASLRPGIAAQALSWLAGRLRGRVS